MVSSVNSLSNNNNYANYKTKKSDNSPIFTHAQNIHPDKIDKSNDGKFSASEAVKNFGKGLASPITSIFSSPKNFLVGVGMIAGSTALVVATGGAAAPLLVAAGVGMGVMQAGKAVYKIASAQNGDDVEKAFYDVGGATSAIGLSALGAKSSLKQASIETKGLNFLSATKKCFTSAKDLTVESFNVFKSGYYKTNINNAITVAKQPKTLRKAAKESYREVKKNFDESFEALKNTLPDELKPYLKGRNKSEISIYEKMVKELKKIDDQTIQIQKNTKLTDVTKQQELSKLQTQKQKISSDINYVKSKVEDGYGARLILDDTSPASMEKLLNHLIDSVKKGDIEITEIENYYGFNAKYPNQNKPYFTEAQTNKLYQSSGYIDMSIKPKASGYTAIQMKIRPKNGEIMELQIRGKGIDEIANWEHIPYDLRQRKDIAKGNNKAGILTAKVKKAIEKLSDEQYKQYQEYVYDNYIYAQAKEFNSPAIKPELPKGIDSCLSAENLQILNGKTAILKPGKVKNLFNQTAQLGLIAGVESPMQD